MKRLPVVLFCSAFGLVTEYSACAADLSGRIIDGQDGEAIARARVAVHVALASGQSTDLVISSDISGIFEVRNLPSGSFQVSAEKSGYLGSSLPVVLSDQSQPVPVILRLTRQSIIDGSVVDEKGLGVPFATVQLFRSVVANGKRQIQGSYNGQADERGEFRIFGLPAGRYYAGASATSRLVRNSSNLVYAPALLPGVTDIDAAQPIDLGRGTEVSITIRLALVSAHAVSGKILSPGRLSTFSLRQQDPNRFPVQLMNPQWDLDEKNNAFKVSGLPAGTYILEATGQFDDRKQHRATKTVVVGDTDVLGIVLEPSSLAEITGRVTVEGHAATRGVVSSIMLQAAGSSTNAQLDEDGSFRFNDLVPNSYRLVAIPAGSYYVRSILYGGRDARSDDLVLGALPPGPIEIDLGSHGATIQGQLAVPASDLPAPIAIALFRRAGERAVLEKLAYINGSLSQASAMAATLPATVIGQFTMQGVAPGEYVLFAWPADTQIEYAEPGFLRQFESQGVAVRAIEDGVVNVSVEHFPKVER